MVCLCFVMFSCCLLCCLYVVFWWLWSRCCCCLFEGVALPLSIPMIIFAVAFYRLFRDATVARCLLAVVLGRCLPFGDGCFTRSTVRGDFNEFQSDCLHDLWRPNTKKKRMLPDSNPLPPSQDFILPSNPFLKLPQPTKRHLCARVLHEKAQVSLKIRIGLFGAIDSVL